MQVRAGFLLLSLALSLPALAAPGDVDPTFAVQPSGSGWTRVFTPGIVDDHAVAFARTSDGGYVTLYSAAGGSNGRRIGLMRVDGEGQIDSTFGTLGRRTKDAGLIDVTDMIIDSAGRIVVTGTAVGAGGAGDFALLRFNANGSDDLTFDGDGMMTAGFESPGPSDDVAVALVQQNAAAGNRYIVAGSAAPLDGGAPTNPVLLGVLPTGQLDPVFGNTSAAGRSYLNFDDTHGGAATALTITPDNWIVVAGQRNYASNDTDMAALLLAPAGLAFGDAANSRYIRAVDIIDDMGARFDRITAIAMSGPDHAVIVGDATGRMIATRLEIGTGSIPFLKEDTSFVRSGTPERTGLFVGAATNARAADVAVDIHGNLLIAGSVGSPGLGAVQRVHGNGIVPAGGGLRTYRAPATIAPLAYHTEFNRIALDANRPMLFGSATDSGTSLSDFDGVVTRLAPLEFVDYIFVDAFE